ncbi:MAG: hypothetical protein JWN76_2429 [Chitinophagaceae bacterium]|nr:hypothetical protein [Chitinophagaceae bacterium]
MKTNILSYLLIGAAALALVSAFFLLGNPAVKIDEKVIGELSEKPQ